MRNLDKEGFDGHLSPQAFLLVAALLLSSGSRVFATFGYIYILGCILSLLLAFNKPTRNFIKKRTLVLLYVFVIALVFAVQYINFGWNTIPGIINFIAKLLFASTIIAYYGSSFRVCYYWVMFFFCSVSIPLWLLQLIGVKLSCFSLPFHASILVFNCPLESSIRNCGPFWEPGAFAGYILVAFLVFFASPSYLFRHAKASIVLLVALLSTMSTTGYLAFFVLVSLYLIQSRASLSKVIMIACLAICSVYCYSRLDFLEEKITEQAKSAVTLGVGEYSSTRMGAFLFDLYYFKKNPLTGNGLHYRTRYSDHLSVMKSLGKEGGLANTGNGFSNFLGSFGISFYVIYIYLFFVNNRLVRNRTKWSFLLVLLIVLQGECYLSYPLFLGLPFVKLLNS